jgi:purine-binding chemotaxis protein CheW
MYEIDDLNDDISEYVTARVAGQLFGLPIAHVHDVFKPLRATRVPLAPTQVSGILNLRGRIVTLVDLRRRIGMPARDENTPTMAIGIEVQNEFWGLLVDSVGEVMKLSRHDLQPNPANLEQGLARVAAGLFQLDRELLVILDVERVLEFSSESMAA